MASSAAEPNTDCIASNEHHAGVPDRDLFHEGGHGHQLEPGTLGAAKDSKRYGKSDFLEQLKPGQAPAYATARGEAWVGDSRTLLKKIRDESIDLVVTSPPYGLLKKKEYGNEDQNDYVKWFRPFAKELHRVLKSSGSLVINIGGAWQKGQPTRSLYPYRLMLDLCEPDRRRKSAPVFHLAQEFYWLNPAKLPNPVQWANVTRERVKDAVEPVWWLSKDPHPKACNRKVLVPYSKHMQRLIETGKYNSGARPSGWNISKVWARDNGGAIPPNFEADDALNYLFNVLVVSNTSSNDPWRKSVKEAEGNAHPAIFPIALPEFFIRMLTDEGDTVLDPFAGSNSTGWVADNLQRQWIAIDLDEGYVEASRLRWPAT
jgi:site-specific DNA-methyltransferase (cytosine-N4-specific)